MWKYRDYYKITKYLGNIASAFSQLLNVILLGSSRPNQSISTRCYIKSKEGYRRWMIAETVLNGLFLDTDHCRNAFITDYLEARSFVQECELVLEETTNKREEDKSDV